MTMTGHTPPPHTGGHDWRQAGQEIRCVRCLDRFLGEEQVCVRQEPPPPRHAGGRSPLCGAPYSANSDWATTDCAECVRLLQDAPAAGGHDLRADPVIGAVACARCFRDRFDFAEDPYCAPAERDPAYVVRHAHAVRGDELQNLCRPGTYWVRPRKGLNLRRHAAPVTCGDCRDAIAAMPAAAPLHDLRLADGGVACAACFLLAKAGDDLGGIGCDGAAFVRAIPFANPFGRQHMPGCRHRGEEQPLPKKTVRIDCTACMRRIAKAPALPA